MRKSRAVNLTIINGSTSDDGEYCDDSNFQGDFSDESESTHVFARTIQQQLAQFKMQDFELTKNSGLPPITDNEFNIAQINTPFLPKSDPVSVPIECVYTMIAGSNHFPRLTSDYQKMHPSIYFWRDVRNVLETEFTSYAQNYFKEHYTSIKTRLRFFHQIDPTVEKLNSVITLRRDIPNGQILYHYIGYGFLTIADSTISCFDKKTGNYAYYPLKKLFESIKPPVFFIFDCSNAASTIPCLSQTAHFKKEELLKGVDAKEQFITRKIDWDDWFCLCATGVGESLPSDPHLPHDFLTSCIFTPIKTAIVCHTLQFYRSSIVTNNFPLDSSDNPLFNADSPVSIALEHTLSAIVDAIAAESLPADLYRTLFKKDPFISLLFKRFLLAQYLLKPFQIHPASHPKLPDLSIHPLWLHWKMIIDIVVSKNLVRSNSISKTNNNDASDTFTENLFIRSLQSVNGFLKSHQESEIPQSLITILFYFPQKSQMLPSVYTTLAQYAAFSADARSILSKSAVFISLFNALVSSNFSVDVLHNLCYLIIALIKTTPKFIHDISKFNMGNFPNKLFDPKIPSQTKSLIAVIISTLVPINESIRCVAISNQFLTNIKTLLETSDTILSLWLLIIIRRIFDSYGYKLDVIYNLALHIQIATFVHHNSYEVRAAALGVLSCMLQPSEDTINQQLFCLVFFTAFDSSFLVRYNFILFLGRFLSIYSSYLFGSLNNMSENIDFNGVNDSKNDNRTASDANSNSNENKSSTSNSQSISGTFKHQSFSTLINMLFKTNMQLENKPFSFKFLTSIASSDISTGRLVSIGIYINELMIEDSHPSIMTAAQEIKAFIIRSSQFKSQPYGQIHPQNDISNDDEGVPRPMIKSNSNALGFMKTNKINSFNNNNMNSNRITNMSTFVTSTVSNDEISNLANSDSSTTLEQLAGPGRIKKHSLYNLDSDSNTSASFSASNSINDFAPEMLRPMIPESGGDAVFKVCLNQIVNSGSWRITELQAPHEPPISLPQPSLSISPSTKLTTRKVINLKLGRPTCLSYHATSLSFSYATDDGYVVFYDEQKSQFSSTSLGSHVTSLKIGDWNLQPLVLVGTDDGSIYLWDPKRRTPRVTFRADWPGKKSSTFSIQTIQKEPSIDTTIGPNYTSLSMNELASLAGSPPVTAAQSPININNQNLISNTNTNTESLYQTPKASNVQTLDSSTIGAGNAAMGDALSSASGSSYGLFNPSSFLPSSSSPSSFSPTQHSPDSSVQQSNQGVVTTIQTSSINSSQTMVPTPSLSQLPHDQQIPTSSSAIFIHTHNPKSNGRSLSFNNSNSKGQNQNQKSQIPLPTVSSPPLLLSIVPGKNQIVSSRGNNGIVRLWDIDYQKLVAEYSAGGKEVVTAIAMNPFSADYCVAGFRNGLVVELDIRCSSDENEQSRRNLQNVAAPRANEEIVRIVGNMGMENIGNNSSTSNSYRPLFVAATKNGSCLKWSNLDNCTVLSLNEKAPIVDFDAHLHSPLIVFSPLNSPPIMTDFNGNVIHTLKNVGNGSVCAFHPVLPIVAFGTPRGEIISCELTA